MDKTIKTIAFILVFFILWRIALPLISITMFIQSGVQGIKEQPIQFLIILLLFIATSIGFLSAVLLFRLKTIGRKGLLLYACAEMVWAVTVISQNFLKGIKDFLLFRIELPLSIGWYVGIFLLFFLNLPNVKTKLK